MLGRILAIGLTLCAFGNLAPAQLIVSGLSDVPVSGSNISAWLVDVETGRSAPLWRNKPDAFAVRDLDGKVFFPSGSIFTWSYATQGSNPALYGPLGEAPGGQYIDMAAATFAVNSLWAVPMPSGTPGGLYEIVLAPPGQPSLAYLRKASSTSFRGLAFNPLNNKLYTCVEGSNSAAGLYTFTIPPSNPTKIKALPTGMTQVGGVAYGNGKLYLTPRGAGAIRVYDIATAQYEAGTIQSPATALASTPGIGGSAGWAPSLVPGTPSPGTFCSPKNSVQGCVPRMAYTGASSAAAASGFQVRATGVPLGVPGLMLYQIGGPKSSAPFGTYGTPICFGPTGIRRAAPQVSVGSGTCGGSYSLDMNAFASGALGGNPAPALRSPGSVVYCRYWGRDILQHYYQLTDALEYYVGP